MNKGIVLTALSALLYGSIGYFGIRLLNIGLSLSHMLFWRFLFACLLILPLLLQSMPSKKFIYNKKALYSFIILGAIFHASGTALYFEASKTIGTGLSMVLFFTYPIFVVALSFFLKRTPISRSTVLSCLLIVIGSSLIAAGSGMSNFDIRGVVLALLSGFCYGIYVYYSKELNSSLSPILASFCVCFGTACAFLLTIIFSSESLYLPQGYDLWVLLFLFALFGTVLPVLFLLKGMEYLSASTASIISVLEPVAVLVVGVLLLNEPLHAIQLVGAVIIMSATLLVYAKPRPGQLKLSKKF